MNEQKSKQEESVADTTIRYQPQEFTLVEQANIAAKRMEDANKRTEELLLRQEAETARRMLGGRSEGSVQVEPEVKMTDREYAAKMMKGEVNPMKEDGFK